MYQKTEYYRDKDLLRLAQDSPCLLQVASNCLGGGGVYNSGLSLKLVNSWQRAVNQSP